MKLRIYVRVARTKEGAMKVSASLTPNYDPLHEKSDLSTILKPPAAIPTARCSVEIDVPDDELLGKIKDG